MTNKLRLITLVIATTDFGQTIAAFGPQNVIAVAASRNTEQVLVIGKIDADSLTKLDGETIDNRNITDDIDVNIDNTKWCQLATIERRNGFYAVIADQNFAMAPGFKVLMDQIKKKKVAAFDTTFAHVDSKKKCWTAPMGKNARLVYVDTKDVTKARFNLLGLVFATEDDTKLQLVTYGDLSVWYDNTSNSFENKETIYSFDETIIRSLSHVNGELMVVNTNDGKYVLDLSPLRTPGNDVKLLAKDEEHLGLNFAGQINVAKMDDKDDTVVYVDFSDQPKARFVPLAKLTPAMQTYAGYNQTTANAK